MSLKKNVTLGLSIGRIRDDDGKFRIFIRALDKHGDDTKETIPKTLVPAYAEYVYVETLRDNVWVTDVDRHDELVSTYPQITRRVPPEILHIINDTTGKVDVSAHNLPPMYDQLRDLQKADVRFLIERGGRGMNGGEMGTGKTATGICLSEYYDSHQPQLIVCPAGLRCNWKHEFKKFTHRDDVHIVENGQSDFRPDARNIISYSLLSTPKIRAKLCPFKVIIMDESHYIKSRTSQRTKLLLKLAKKAEKVILLTGTPSSKSADLFTQLKAIDPDNFTTFFPYLGRGANKSFYFASRYCHPTKVRINRTQFAYTFNGNDHSWELHAVLSKYMTRSTKSQALKGLPPKTREKIVVHEASKQRKRQFESDLQSVEALREEKGARAAEFKLMELVHETAKLKLKSVITYVKHVIDRDDSLKYLVFAHHRIVLDALVELMTSTKQEFITIDGRTSTSKRQALVDRFQNDDDNVKFAVLSIRAAGVGLNFFKGHVVIFTELLWSEKDHIQAEDRIHRHGVQHPVLVQYLIMTGSTDEVIWRTLNGKVRSAGAVVDNKRTFLQTDMCSTFDKE